ncbi:MAG TPA: T9SS type A sorting domain-containing protein, partial [Bacteroidales bacterium]|nr:T9SS type A sorting domain-containing protein [Bacteroidales bacterium]
RMIRFVTLLLFFSLSVPVFCQFTNIVIGETDMPNEPSIAINPKNTAQMVAGANIKLFYHSSDSGYTWQQGQLTSTYGVYGDPCIIADTAGNFYFFHLSDPVAGNWLDRIVCQKSVNGGQTWSNGSYAGLNGNKDQDKEWAVVDPANNNIYLTWTEFDSYGSSNHNDSTNILFSKSSDAGLSWSVPARINRVAGDCLDMDSTVEGAVPAVGPAGQIYVSWAGPAGLVFNRSLDEGTTWLDSNIFVSDIPGGWDYAIPGIYLANGLPVTCCDLSNGPHRGNIYINWSDQRNGEEDTDIWFKKSTDGGLTWESLVRINNDPPGKQQFFTWMTVDQVSGFIYIVFYDRRDLPGNLTDVYLALSKDGGSTFENFRISESPFNPVPQIFFGDYTNISAHNGIVRPVWARQSVSEISIVTAVVDRINTGTGHKPPSIASLSMDQNYPNPGKEKTYISFRLHRTSPVTLKVYDLYGQEIALIIDNQIMESGKYVRSFDIAAHRLSAGIYYFSLVSGEESLIRKMIVE